ncbi:MAG: prenyltransferase [Methanomicrobiales archaeon]|nr:prenyltransferase [Methanomicrobiales archaeon]
MEPVRRMGSVLHLWVRLGRLPFLLAGMAGFLLGALFALLQGAAWDPARCLAGYFVLGFAHLSVSYSNDYFDRESDWSGSTTPFSGGSGVLQQHPGIAAAARGFALFLILLSLLSGALFAAAYAMPWWYLLVVAGGNAIGWWYSAPPLRLSVRRGAELVTAAAVGALVPGMGYVTVSGTADPFLALFCAPLVCMGVAFALAVAMPDMESDVQSGKGTFIARHGRQQGWSALLLAAAGMSCCYAAVSVLAPPAGLDFWPLSAASLVIVAAAAAGSRTGCRSRHCTVRAAGCVLAAIVGFCCIADGYFLLLLCSAG